jgi:predicted ATP-binding protein involved in virulence
MRNSNLKSFSIKGLFGDRTVTIPFKDDVKILIGENGLGKTTVLSMLYYTLTNKIFKLKDFDFKSLELSFTDGQKISIEKEKLQGIDDDIEMNIPAQLLNNISRSIDTKDIIEISEMFAKDYPPHMIFDKIEMHRYSHNILGRYPARMVISALKIICGYGEGNAKIKKAKETLQKELIDTEILYFPTFRRIEEDLINLGLEDEKNKINQGDVRLIQFGMKDVKERFEELKKEINSLSSRGLSQISSEILSQLVKGVPNINNSALQNISKKDIDIILARVGEAISKDDKEKITSIVSAKKLKDIDDKYLVYFLQKLITIYEKQREIDNSIESFVSVCNNYLKYSDKEIEYEASEVEFYLKSIKTNKKVLLTNLLSKLSSGEKQIISLFSRIYLSKSKNFIVLFDEPELSLSIFWQKLLLPDIVASKKCKFLLSVTHSPFIFENELAKYAIGLSQYIKN